MNPQSHTFIRYRLDRAEQAIRVAKRDLDAGDLHHAVSRMYYACFFAVSALLLTKGLSASKHKRVQSLFGQHWIKTGEFPKEMGRFFHRLFENRLDADYADLLVFDSNDVAGWFQEAQAFVNTLSNYIEPMLGVERGDNHG